MSFSGTSVGLDVHALSVVAHAVDEETGQVNGHGCVPITARSWTGCVGCGGRWRWPMRPARPGSAWPGRWPRPGSVCGGGAVEAAAPGRGSGQDRRPRRRAPGPAAAPRRDHRGAVPDAEQEAARDLVRAREDARADLMRARHRLSKLLLRHGLVYSGGQAWTGAHETWLRRQRFDHARPAAGVRAPLRGGAVPRRPAATAWMRRSPTVRPRRGERPGRPAGLPARGRGPDRVRRWPWRSATGTGSPAPRSAPTWAWCPPSTPRAASRAQGSITKTGNSHARRLLVEAAWHHRKPPTGTQHDDAGPLGPGRPRAQARGDAGNRRLHHAGAGSTPAASSHVIANVAVARELAGWCWSLAVLD